MDESARFVGRPIRRREDPRLLAGQGIYVADLTLPGMLHAAILRSPHAHARIRRIDGAEAARAPGVLFVGTAADLGPAARPLPLLNPAPTLRPRMPTALAAGSVRYVGEPVAVVVAADRYAAEDALDLIRVEYEALPAVADAARALEPGAPRVHDDLDSNLAARTVQTIGDVEPGFRAADLVVRERLAISRGGGGMLETRGVLAAWDPRARKLQVWSSTQAPHLIRRVLTQMLELPDHQVRVAVPEVGGGFGAKLVCYPEDVLIPWLALRLRRPVKWVEDRREDLLSTVQEREQYHQVEVAVRRDGTVLALRNRFVCDAGAYVPWGLVVSTLTATTLGPYKFPAYQVEALVAYTHRVPVSVIRGAGRPQATFLFERAMDRVAEAVGLDPAEVRRRNFIRPHEFPYRLGLIYRDGTEMAYDNGDYPAALDRALLMAGHAGFRERQRAALARGRRIGIGISCQVEGTGLGPFESATVRVDGLGKVHVATGACPQGQAHETTLAQVAADELGIPPDDVAVTTGDTDAVGFGIGTFASRTGAVASGAVVGACRLVREKAVAAAAHLLEAARDDLVWDRGRVLVRGAPSRAVTLGEAAGFLAGIPGRALPADLEAGLQATHHFRPAGLTYSNAAAVAVVEVDVETGAVRIEGIHVVHDCGRLINPMVVDGQIQGGVAHGVSNALFEEVPYDAAGQPLAATFMDYLIPTAAEVPPVEIAHMETPSPLNPAGVKGAGEGGAIVAPAAIAAAIEDALRPLGVRITALPLPPERLRRLIAAAQTAPSR
ncbi:MAG TPA: xanthine dehydrogenase family protein molybdopterin-binding subunit [Candidatus Sulfotelmatobacter sp.]|nr:xanthine dehydrogenase family protein molybdopterin-binding subunit [Candidatus Sulfotelmatobacter sp.]